MDYADRHKVWDMRNEAYYGHRVVCGDLAAAPAIAVARSWAASSLASPCLPPQYVATRIETRSRGPPARLCFVRSRSDVRWALNTNRTCWVRIRLPNLPISSGTSCRAEQETGRQHASVFFFKNYSSTWVMHITIHYYNLSLRSIENELSRNNTNNSLISRRRLAERFSEMVIPSNECMFNVWEHLHIFKKN